MSQSIAKIVTFRGLGGIGFLIFAGMFSLTISVPTWVEDFAAEYIEKEAIGRIDNAIDLVQQPSGEGRLSRLAQSVFASNEERISQLRAELKSQVHLRIADAIAEIREFDCECRDKYAEMLEQGTETEMGLLQAANTQIVEFIQSRYMSVATELKRDIRIFTGSNALTFFLLLIVSLMRPQAITHLFIPGILLAFSTLTCSYFYIAEQNWLLTIIYNDYFGFAYLGWLGFVFLFLSDIVLNRARVTTELINALLHTIGSASQVVPC